VEVDFLGVPLVEVAAAEAVVAGKKQSKKMSWKKLNKLWLGYQYKHATIAIVAILLFILLLDSVFFASVFAYIKSLGYFGGFIAGFLSVSFFTAAPAVILMIELSTQFEPYLLALVISVGSTIGDWITIKFYDEKVFAEFKPLFRKLRIPSVIRIMKHRFTSWILFLIGAFIIATPIPDEVGLSLMGISKFKRRYILFICFLLNTLGALTLILAARALR
jgi:membrane protein YqaA with SNARE-associated domain